MGYGQAFARVYNTQWAEFSRRIAPVILDFYETTFIGKTNRFLLDLCCGCGHFALEALHRGYSVTGIDASPDMLTHAKENTRRYLAKGQVDFIETDARSFSLERRFGLVVSTYDSLNHMENEDDLKSVFASVASVVPEDGYFIFDLNTRARLQKWTEITVMDDDEMTIINRSIYVGEQGKAFVKISGYIKAPNGFYERFDETLFNTVFDMEKVRQLLLETGWKEVYSAGVADLTVPVSDPEELDRVFFVARK
ncbi:methyltransferase type 11 [Fischerella thermalis CCMEE 5273]|nr:methyltransferase type 11 [Fischerella thermalis CCMEE 5273]